MRLSIIVPVYNVEPYVERCLRSLLEKQELSLTNYEVIVTNDGSPDNSRAVVERLQQEFSNLILINQVNQGVSMARNSAIAIAQGDYILPIDPDDYAVPQCLLPALEQAERNNLDVLYCAYEIFDENDRSVWRTDYSHLENRIDNGYDGYFAVRGPKVRDPDRSVAILYRRNLLRRYEIEYPKDVPMLEDGLFLGKVFTVAERVGYSNHNFYQRTTRQGSATQSNKWNDEDTLRGYITVLHELKSFDIYTNKKNTDINNHLKAKYAFLALYVSINKCDIVQYYHIVNKIKSVNVKYDTYGVKFNYKRMLIIFNISPFLFFLTNRVLK